MGITLPTSYSGVSASEPIIVRERSRNVLNKLTNEVGYLCESQS